MNAYAGPLRDEPLGIELHNTVYVSRGELVDGLAEPRSAAAWLAALGDRLLQGGSGREPTPDELTELRRVVRDVLQVTVDGQTPSRADVDALNRAAARAPRSRSARWRRDAPPLGEINLHGASRTDVVLSALASDAIDLITSPRRDDLRACGAPSCVLMFLKDHPRREWCSTACGNRARQARHYRRARGRMSVNGPPRAPGTRRRARR
jgi:predicted RNA-binding Zn ribbon-like protein